MQPKWFGTGESAGLGGTWTMRTAKIRTKQHMDANISDKPGAAAAVSGLDMVRARASRQKQVRLTRTDTNDALSARACFHSIRTLKSKSVQEIEPHRAEPSFLNRVWADFQELLGNR
jgi:hypothetical protein